MSRIHRSGRTSCNDMRYSHIASISYMCQPHRRPRHDTPLGIIRGLLRAWTQKQQAVPLNYATVGVVQRAYAERSQPIYWSAKKP